MKNLQKSIALFLAFAIVLTLSPIESSAKWRDNSSNLPGLASDGQVTTALVVLGAVVVGGIVLLVVKHKSKTKSTVSTSQYMNSTLSFNPKSSLLQKFEMTGRSLPINLILAPVSSSHDMALGKTNGVQVGLRIRF